MRAREFIHEFAPPGLAGALQQTINAAKQPGTADYSKQTSGYGQTTMNAPQGIPGQQQTQQNPSPNQTKTPAAPQGGQGTANAQQATSGGTQTPQNGVPSTGTPPQQKQPMGQQPAQQSQQPSGNKPLGIGGAFLSGLTGGKATSLGSLAKLGAASVARASNMNNVAGQIDQSRYDSELKTGNTSGGAPTPQELQTTLKQGSTIKIPGQDDFKVGKIDNTGVELTGNKLGKVKVDLKSLAGQK